MNESQREQVEKRLRAERERAVEAMRRLDEGARASTLDDGELSNWPLHLADQGTDTMEAEKALLLMSQEGRQLHEIDEALRRLFGSPEEFGHCEACGAAIGMDRLDIVPWARFCVDCQEKVEAEVTTAPRMADADPELPAER
jgi:DnaK suppressor protein